MDNILTSHFRLAYGLVGVAALYVIAAATGRRSAGAQQTATASR
jgi:uncharacterized membrane protein YuzA (DUF378 family)